MTNDDVAKDGIAFAIAYADNCVIPEGFANDKKYDNQDWMSDWAAYLAEAVWAELHRRGFKILRPLTDTKPEWVSNYEKRLCSDLGPAFDPNDLQ